LSETGFATVSVLVSTVLTAFLLLQQPTDLTLETFVALEQLAFSEETFVALEEQVFESEAFVALEAQQPSSETLVTFAEVVLLQDASVFEALSPHLAKDGDVIPNERPINSTIAIRFFISFPFFEVNENEHIILLHVLGLCNLRQNLNLCNILSKKTVIKGFFYFSKCRFRTLNISTVMFVFSTFIVIFFPTALTRLQILLLMILHKTESAVQFLMHELTTMSFQS
jgi:hypothetical protein